uniref:Fumarate hydratase n=1 Tax=Vibrio splendidus TaxID=29497 RepID=A0A0H3ZT63_VIBSP|nr:hypothetical protein [Vibrio splendidus]
MTIKNNDNDAICKDICCILRIIEQANKSGDEATKETLAGIVLLRGLVNEIRGNVSTT